MTPYCLFQGDVVSATFVAGNPRHSGDIVRIKPDFNFNLICLFVVFIFLYLSIFTFFPFLPLFCCILQRDKTFVTVEIYDNRTETWEVVHTDASWETRYSYDSI